MPVRPAPRPHDARRGVPACTRQPRRPLPTRAPRTPVRQSAGAISSDAYFGRETERPGSSPGSSLDFTASELVSKISLTAREDMAQIKSMATAAGSKLSSLAQGFLRDLQGGY